MTHDPRPHIARRGLAIGRLRSLTTGAAVAGLAGVAGFGVVAAASWSGDPNATSAPDGDSTTTDAGSGATGPGSLRAVPNPVTAPRGAGATTPRVQPGNGSGHAVTGGSN